MVRVARYSSGGDAVVSNAKSTATPEPAHKILKKKKKKRAANRTGWNRPKRVSKKPGFTAFEVKETAVTDDGETIVTSKVVAPETGIHSLDWAANIAPQRGFLSLPVEVRKQIYNHIFDGSIVNTPRRKGLKFTAIKAENNALEIYNVLATLSRQMYVDIVGSGLLYQCANFSFSSSYAMIRYLDCINPAHRASIRNVHLTITLSASSPRIPSKTLFTLGSLPSLMDLSLTFSCHMSQCIRLYSASLNMTANQRRNPYNYILRSEVLGGLMSASWGDLEGLSRFDASFELYEVKGLPYTLSGWFLSQHVTKLEFIEQAREIVTRKAE